MLPSIQVVDVEFDDGCVHLCRLREADRATMQALDVRPEIEIVAFDTLRPVFADVVALGV